MKLQAAKKGSSIILLALLAASMLLILVPQSDGALAKPSVPEFSVKLTTHIFDVPASSSTDQFTGKTTTIPGIHHEYQTIDLTIKNQPFTPYVAENASGNTVNLVYNIRYRGPYAENWTLLYADVNYPIQNYTSPNTVISLATVDASYTYGLKVLSVPQNMTTIVEFQVQALVGHWHRLPVMFSDFEFEGEASDWSNTQTITVGGGTPANQPTVSPTQPSNGITTNPTQSGTPQGFGFWVDWQTVVIAVLAVAVVVLALVVVLQRRGNRKAEGQ